MRFICVIILSLFIASPAQAKPGDVYGVDHKTLPQKSQKGHAGSQLTLRTVDGFDVKRLKNRLQKTVALSGSGHDLYVLESKSGTLLKLRDHNNDGQFESQAPYLIGIVNGQDMVATDEHLYILDQNGVWRADNEMTISASKAPILLVHKPASSRGLSPKFLAVHPPSQTLFVSYDDTAQRSSVYEIDMKSGAVRASQNFAFQILDLCITPSGKIWAPIHHNDTYGITALALNGIDQNVRPTFTVPDAIPQSIPETIQTTRKDGRKFQTPQVRSVPMQIAIYPDHADAPYPKDWSGKMLMAVDGALPMIATIAFRYGELAPTMTSLVEGFASRSARIGYTNVYAYPTALTIMDNGRIVFVDNTGRLWAIDKTIPKAPRRANAPAAPKPAMKKPDQFRSHKDAIFNGEYNANAPQSVDNPPPKSKQKKSPPDKPDGE